MSTYKLQELFNIIYGLLRGEKSNPYNPRSCNKIFICEDCKGRGFFSESKSNMYGEYCGSCEGLGRVALEFTVKKIKLKQKEY